MPTIEMQTAADVIAYVESLHPGCTKPGKKRGNTIFSVDIQFKHVPTKKVVLVTAVSVNPDHSDRALVPEFAVVGKRDCWWVKINELEVLQ